MPDMEFDLGEELGGYEQAQADRNFYLSMVQGGTQMASPIAAYLAGVSGVKMANMRQQAQDVQDAKQAKLDATEAADKAQKRELELQNQVINIMKGTRDGSLAPGAAAAMLGYIAPELGFQMVSFDADNQIAHVKNVKDGQDYQWDLSEQENPLEPGRNKRAEERIAWEREKQLRGIQGQKEVAAYKAGLKDQGQSKGGASVSNRWQSFKTAYGPVIEAINGKNLDELEDMPDRVVEGFIADYDPAFGIDDIFKIVKQEKERRSGTEATEPIAEKKSNNIIGFLFGNK